MMPIWASVVLAIVPIGISFITFVYTVRKDKENKKKQQDLEKNQIAIQKKQSDVEAIAQYRQVKSSERESKKDLIALVDGFQRDSDKMETLFLTAYNSYTDLFNDANAFCSLINHNSVDAEEVLKNTGIDLLIKLADYQCEGYEKLKQAAEKIGSHSVTIRRPEANAFIEYNTFLKMRMDNNRWDSLKEKRKQTGLFFVDLMH